STGVASGRDATQTTATRACHRDRDSEALPPTTRVESRRDAEDARTTCGDTRARPAGPPGDSAVPRRSSRSPRQRVQEPAVVLEFVADEQERAKQIVGPVLHLRARQRLEEASAQFDDVEPGRGQGVLQGVAVVRAAIADFAIANIGFVDVGFDPE